MMLRKYVYIVLLFSLLILRFEPASGYSFQSGPRHDYSFQTGPKPEPSFKVGPTPESSFRAGPIPESSFVLGTSANEKSTTETPIAETPITEAPKTEKITIQKTEESGYSSQSGPSHDYNFQAGPTPESISNVRSQSAVKLVNKSSVTGTSGKIAPVNVSKENKTSFLNITRFNKSVGARASNQTSNGDVNSTELINNSYYKWSPFLGFFGLPIFGIILILGASKWFLI